MFRMWLQGQHMELLRGRHLRELMSIAAAVPTSDVAMSTPLLPMPTTTTRLPSNPWGFLYLCARETLRHDAAGGASRDAVHGAAVEGREAGELRRYGRDVVAARNHNKVVAAGEAAATCVGCCDNDSTIIG
jgi:hypothetical protein